MPYPDADLINLLNQESGIIYSGKFTINAIYKVMHTAFIVHIDVGCWLLETVCLEDTHINYYRHKEDVCNAVMVR